MDGLMQFLRTLGATRVVALAATMAASIAFFFWLTTRLTAPNLVPLTNQLELDEAGKIAARLDALGVTYQVRGSGVIMVPEDQAPRLRMTLAKDGLPSGGGIGFEIFDRSDALGTTSFVQNVNYTRALEGEIARTIRTIGSVASARVHLVLPKREAFSREAKEASASITLAMRSGARLDRAQVQAIQHLVATAVPDLKPAQISIVDEKGTLLAKGGLDGGTFGLGTTAMEELRANHEARLRQAIITALEPVVGSGKVRAVVAVDLDMERITSQSETYDPDGQVLRSAQSVEESSSSNESEQEKAVTAQNNLPEAQKGGQAAGAGGPKSTNANSRAEKTENFEIGKKVTSQVREAGGIKRVSAAVLVDGVYTLDANGKRVYAPRDEQTLQKLDSLVRSAMMFTEARGDRIEVANLRFADPKEEAAVSGEPPLAEPFLGMSKSDWFRVGEIAALGILGALVLLLVVRPMVGRMLQPSPPQPMPQQGQAALPNAAGQMAQHPGHPGQAALPRPAGTELAPVEGHAGFAAPGMPQLPASTEEMIDLAQVEGRVKQSSVNKVGEIVSRHPDQALTIVRNWLHEPART